MYISSYNTLVYLKNRALSKIMSPPNFPVNYADIKARALILFLLSSGGRTGEALQLLEEDIDLEADPPRAHIRREYTKAGVGERTVFFSYEARDAIRDWLQVKDSLDKRGRGDSYKGDKRVFPFRSKTAIFLSPFLSSP